MHIDDVIEAYQSTVRYIERRVNTLDEHIRQGGIYLAHRELFAEYQQLKPRKQTAFCEAHRAELMAIEAAKRCLDACLNGHALLLAKLAAERGELSSDYAALKEQVLAAENIQWTAEKILREAKQPQKDKWKKAREL